MTDIETILAGDLAVAMADSGSRTGELLTYTPPGGAGQSFVGYWSHGSASAEGQVASGSVRHYDSASVVTSQAELPAVDEQGTITRGGVSWSILHAEPIHDAGWMIELARKVPRSQAPERLTL